MKNQEMMDKVYEEIADKTLLENTLCKIIVFNRNKSGGHLQDGEIVNYGFGLNGYETKGYIPEQCYGFYEVLGLPLHYGYAVDWIEKKFPNMGQERLLQLLNIQGVWKDKTKPIESPENIEALTYLYNLIQGKN